MEVACEHVDTTRDLTAPPAADDLINAKEQFNDIGDDIDDTVVELIPGVDMTEKQIEAARRALEKKKNAPQPPPKEPTPPPPPKEPTPPPPPPPKEPTPPPAPAEPAPEPAPAEPAPAEPAPAEPAPAESAPAESAPAEQPPAEPAPEAAPAE